MSIISTRLRPLVLSRLAEMRRGYPRFLSFATISVGAMALPVVAFAQPSVIAIGDEPIDHGLLLMAALMVLGALVLLALLFLNLRASNRRALEAEQLLTTAIDTISDGFAIYDANDRLVLCNQQLRDMYPVIAERLVPGAKCSDLARALGEAVHADAPADREDTIAALSCGAGEKEIQLADGRWLLHRDRKLPGGGKVGVRTDISQLKARERSLQDDAARYRDLVERSPVPIYVHRDTVILYANAATAKILGYPTANDIVGKTIYDLVHPDHHKLVARRRAQAEQNDKPLGQVDMKFRRFDGTDIYTEAHVSPVEYNGEPALESILYDISARRRTERAMIESEQRYRNLFELSPDAILIHDGTNILFTNDTAAEMFGASSDTSLFGLPIATLIRSSTDTCPLSAPEDGRAPLGVQSCLLHRLDDDTFNAEVIAAPTTYHGQKVHQAVVRDVTERKRMDATMTQNAKLASLGRMAAGLAHELSQPLNIMRFAADGGLLKMSKNVDDGALHARNYRLIQDQAERMASVMDNMRVFSRKDPGPMQPFDLSLSVRNISHLVRNPFRVDDVHIELLGPACGIHTHGNAIQLEQVLLNLLNNARDSILEHRRHSGEDEPGRITLDCQISGDHDHAKITVSDNGGGIAPEILAQIFDPFFTTKDVGHGTGLGLALSHEIISTMSGTLSADNVIGGARFTIRLPLSEGAKPDLDPKMDPGTAATQNDAFQDAPTLAASLSSTRAEHGAIHPPMSVKHILVVEDEIEAARALADFLRDEGFEVSVAHNGREGLDAYHTLRPDLVITDIRMPGMDGIGLIQALRAEQANLPIIAVTGHMGDGEAIEAGGGTAPVKVMQKPVSLMAIYREIGEIGTA